MGARGNRVYNDTGQFFWFPAAHIILSFIDFDSERAFILSRGKVLWLRVLDPYRIYIYFCLRTCGAYPMEDFVVRWWPHVENVSYLYINMRNFI